MSKNIFENAYFGKAYKTRDGRKAMYHHKRKEEHLLILETKLCAFVYDDNGYYKSPNCQTLDIITEWQEEIYEEKLDKLAEEANPNNPHGDTYEVGQYFGFEDGFKAGYCKAKEE